jgi:hypothetical protein
LLKQMAGATAFLAILANGAAGPKTALAADGAVSTAATAAQAAATRAYWTAERLTSAKPLYMTTAKTLNPASGLAVATGPTTLTPGAPPSVAYDRNWAEALLTLSNSTSS